MLFLVPIRLKYCHGNHKPPKTGLLHDLIQFGLSFLCYSGRFCIENWPNFHLNKKNCSSISENVVMVTKLFVAHYVVYGINFNNQNDFCAKSF